MTSDAPLTGDGEGELAFARARRTVQDVLTAATDPNLLPEQAGQFLWKLFSLGDSLYPTLAEMQSHPDAKCRLLAAWLLLKFAERTPRVARRKQALKRARQLILDALKQEDFALKLYVCVHLSNGGVPQETIPRLTDLLEHQDAVLALYAAAALSWCGEAVAQAIPILTKALHHDDELLSTVAANGLARLGLRQPEAIIELTRRLHEVPTARRYGVLLALRDAGVAAEAAASELEKIADDISVSGLLRGAAAEALGSVRPDGKATRNTLRRLLNEQDAIVVEGALHGLNRSGGVPSDTLTRLQEMLRSSDSALRRAGALGVRLLGSKARAALEELVQALCQEQDRENVKLLAWACAELGPAVVQPLCQVIRQGNMQHVGAASAALMMLGRSAAEEIAKSLLTDEDEVIRWTGVALLRGLGSDVGPAIPALAAMLPSLSDDRAVYVLMLFATCRADITVAVPAVVACWLERQGEVAELAGKVLQSMGKPAAAVLEARLASASGDVRQKIEDTLARFQPTAQFASPRLLSLNADKSLLLFLFAGEVIEKNEPIGLREVAKKLEGMATVTLMKLPTSEASLRGMLTELQDGLGFPLTRKTTKGNLLTDEGRALLVETRPYLQWRGWKV
jgi:hypothetical protein